MSDHEKPSQITQTTHGNVYSIDIGGSLERIVAYICITVIVVTYLNSIAG